MMTKKQKENKTMIVYEPYNNGNLIYSDKGKPILQKDTGIKYIKAFEKDDGLHHIYEEVAEEEGKK